MRPTQSPDNETLSHDMGQLCVIGLRMFLCQFWLFVISDFLSLSFPFSGIISFFFFRFFFRSSELWISIHWPLLQRNFVRQIQLSEFRYVALWHSESIDEFIILSLRSHSFLHRFESKPVMVQR